MHPAVDGMPTPIGDLDSLLDFGDSTEVPRKVFIGYNFGHKTFLMHLPMYEFYNCSEVANDPGKDGDSPVTQRKLDAKHAQSLAVYILKGLVSSAIELRRINGKDILNGFDEIQEYLGKQPYMSLSPLIVNIRECDQSGANIRGFRMVHDNETACFKVFLSQKHVMWVIDGQHRRKAMQYVFEFLDYVRINKAYPKKNNIVSIAAGQDVEFNFNHESVWNEAFAVARQYGMVSVEAHLGLLPEQERQLFHDLNNLGKKVEKSLALQFDNSNPVNLFIKEVLIERMGIDVVEKDVTDWNQDDGAISRKDLVAVNAILFLNKTNISGASPVLVQQRADIAKRFWEGVLAIPYFGETGGKTKTVAAQPVVLKALAKLLNTFAFGRYKNEYGDEVVEGYLDRISDIDFSHDNPVWRYYSMSDAERAKSGFDRLSEYLPPMEDGANRDLGAFQNGVMRFGAKHNDIYPIIGDMVRWMMQLPPRGR